MDVEIFTKNFVLKKSFVKNDALEEWLGLTVSTQHLFCWVEDSNNYPY
jgi:hypothetical protein